MKIRTAYFMILLAVCFSGCASTYQAPADLKASSFLNFERHVDAPILGSTTVFVHVRDEFNCKAGQGFLGEQKLATLDKGNPLVSSKNVDGIRIEAKENFRILVRNIAGMNWHDTIVGFRSEPGQKYKMVLRASRAAADVPSSYSVELFRAEDEAGNGSAYRKIQLNEYQDCQTL